MIYREDLPEKCPPENAVPLVRTTTFYRLVEVFPPTERDFDSIWSLRPNRREDLGRQRKECEAKGLSLFDNPAEAHTRTNSPEHAHKMVCEVNVTPQCGPVIQGRSHHFTWWPLTECNVLALCAEYNP